MTTMRASWARQISVDPITGCWVWSGCADEHGYGRVTVDRKSWLLHRYMWSVVREPIPPRTHLHHECERPACCNPQHLSPVPVSEHRRIHDYSGISAAWEAKRTRTHCTKGHELTPDNLRIKRTDGFVRRLCRTCIRAAEQARRARKDTP